MTPLQPKERKERSDLYLKMEVEAKQVSTLRIEAYPVSKLPLWHRGKGDRGWFFIDEVVLQ